MVVAGQHRVKGVLCTLSSTGTPNDRLRALQTHLSGLQGTARIVSVIDVVQPCFLHFTCTRTDRVQNIYRAKNRLSQCTRRGVVQSSAQVDERAAIGTCAYSLRDMRSGEGWCSRGIVGGEFGGALRLEIGILTWCMCVVARVSESSSSLNASASAPNALKCDCACVRECVVRAEVDRRARGHVYVVSLVYSVHM